MLGIFDVHPPITDPPRLALKTGFDDLSAAAEAAVRGRKQKLKKLGFEHRARFMSMSTSAAGYKRHLPISRSAKLLVWSVVPK